MEKEKRSRERLAINDIIELSTSDGMVIKTQGINMSEKALLCKADIEIHQGTYVMFQLPVPGAKTAASVSCEGTVLRCCKEKNTGNGKYDIVIDFID